MNDESSEPSEPLPETVTQQLKRRFKDMMLKDIQFINAKKENNDQNPLSNAYISTCSFAKSQKLAAEEQKQNLQNYHIDEEKRLREINATQELRELCRKNLIQDGRLPQGQIDPLFANPEKMNPPPELVRAFIAMQKSAIRFRLSEDDDF